MNTVNLSRNYAVFNCTFERIRVCFVTKLNSPELDPLTHRLHHWASETICFCYLATATPTNLHRSLPRTEDPFGWLL